MYVFFFKKKPFYNLLRWLKGGHLDVVKFLLEKGADVNFANKEAVTPLWVASQVCFIPLFFASFLCFLIFFEPN